jgi:hypothetical protein
LPGSKDVPILNPSSASVASVNIHPYVQTIRTALVCRFGVR